MAVPELDEREPLLKVRGLKKYFPVKNQLGRTKAYVKAVDDVSFDLYEGETFGLVGESGCGKSTTGRAVLRLTEPSDGEVLFQNRNLLQLSKRDLRAFRSQMQMVFQDPYSSLNPRKRIGNTLEEALAICGIGTKAEREKRVIDILSQVGLQSDHYYRFPHEFSGGQRQRIGLARALILNPKVIICDESVSALDVSVQSQILNLLRKLQRQYNLTYLFIAHDISVVRYISDRIGVMYLGHMMESAPTDRLFTTPLHPYTQALLSAIPVPDPRLKTERVLLQGEIPSPLHPPEGCVFHTRCPYATEVCRSEKPLPKEVSVQHTVSCHLVEG